MNVMILSTVNVCVNVVGRTAEPQRCAHPDPWKWQGVIK
jgi:hypothetical protein